MARIEPFQGKYVTAKSASADIDLDTIESGCNSISGQLADINTIHGNYSETANSIDSEALSLNGNSPIPDHLSTCDGNINGNKQTIEGILNDTIQTAESEYNKLQLKYNREAYLADLAEIKKHENSENNSG